MSISLMGDAAAQFVNTNPNKQPFVRIIVVDDLEPEVLAMLQAAYSRTHVSIVDRLLEIGYDERIREYKLVKIDGKAVAHVHGLFRSPEATAKSERLKAAMQKWYLNYGHASIADCGNTTIFIEGCSLLAAKAVQDNLLYNGQETSTRYIDFAKQPYFRDPENKGDRAALLLDVYQRVTPVVIRGLQDRNPEAPENSVKAAAFDIMRSLLPGGVTTQLSWTSSLRKVRDNLLRLATWPLQEVRDLAGAIHYAMHELYPSSFLSEEMVPVNTRQFRTEYYAMPDTDDLPHLQCVDGFTMNAEQFKRELHDGGRGFPAGLNSINLVRVASPIDFGSYRDIQRHRTLRRVGAYPMLTADAGFEGDYLTAMRDMYEAGGGDLQVLELDLNDIYNSIQKDLDIVASCRSQARTGSISAILLLAEMQYELPLMMKVHYQAIGGIGDFAYMCKLRAGDTVHATARKFLSGLKTAAREYVFEPLIEEALHTADYIDAAKALTKISVKRGTQTFQKSQEK